MSTFSRRSGIRKEFSGPDEASPVLRNRLNQVAERYVARGYIGVGNEARYVWGPDLDHRLAMEFGKKVSMSGVLLEGEWHDVLTAVEIYLVEARSAYHIIDYIRAGFAEAFRLSGSVYYLDRDDRVALRMDADVAARVGEASKVMAAVSDAKAVFDGAVSGLLSRRAKPEDVVKDLYVAFEEYLKRITGQKDFSNAVGALRRAGTLTSTQAALMQKLEGFRSETFGSSHAGEARTPTMSDTLWFVDTVSAQVKFLANLVGKKAARAQAREGAAK